MKLNEFVHHNLKSRSILNESWELLSESQKIYIGRWEKELWPLLEEYVRVCEEELTSDQIEQLFTNIETTAAERGDNRTGIGKTVDAGSAGLKISADVAKKVNDKLNELGRMAQEAGPIKNADQKFEQLKKDIKEKNSDSKVIQGIEKVSDWAKENPGKATIAVGILTTIAAFAGGPAGGAVAGFILRSTRDLLRGDKLSTAAGKATKTAILGMLAGKAFQYLSGEAKEFFAGATAEDLQQAADAIVDAEAQNLMGEAKELFGADADAFKEAFPDGAFQVSVQSTGTGGNYFSGDVVLTSEQHAQYAELQRAADRFNREAFRAGGFDGNREARDELRREATRATARAYAFLEEVKATTNQEELNSVFNAGRDAFAELEKAGRDAINDPEVQNKIAQLTGDAAKDIKTFNTIADIAASAGQGAATSATIRDTKKSGRATNENTHINEFSRVGLSETQVLLLFEGIMDKIKGAASSAADKAKDVAKSAIGKGVGKAKQVGKDITTKVTANKLMRAWEKAGKPTDSDKIASILSQVGVDQEILSDVYDQMNIPFDPETLEQPSQQQQQQQQQPAQQQQQQQQQQPAQSGGQWTDANELVEFLKAALKKLKAEAPETYQRIASEVLGK